MKTSTSVSKKLYLYCKAKNVKQKYSYQGRIEKFSKGVSK